LTKYDKIVKEGTQTNGVINGMQESWKNDLLNKDPKVRKRTVIAMAESRDPDALKILKFLHEKDADPQIRELAKKAGTHLWNTLQEQKAAVAPTQKIEKQQKPAAPASPKAAPPTPAKAPAPPAKVPGASAPAQKPTPPAPAQASAASAPTQRPTPTPVQKPQQPAQPKVESPSVDAFDLPAPQTEMNLEDDDYAVPSVDVNSKQIATARIHVARATALVVRGKKNEALYYLQNACQINPELQKEELVLNLAGELTGLPKHEAIKTIMAMKASSTTQNTGTQNRTLLYIGIGVGVVIALIIAAILIF
jgi:hypothetical protein